MARDDGRIGSIASQIRREGVAQNVKRAFLINAQEE
jgi:hypothetical protein